MATYRYVLTTREGVALGELRNATGRVLNKTLNGIDTAGFSLQLADPLARELVNPDPSTGQLREHLLKVYRQADGAPQLVFHGPVVDVEAVYTGTGGTVQVNAASPFWTLQHRLAGKDRADLGAPRTVKPVTGQRAQIAADLLAAANGEGTTGIVPSPVPPTTQTTIDDIAYRPVAELITELSRGQLGAQAADGFDFVVEPTEYSSGQIGILRLGASNPADPKSLHVVLYGGRRDEVVFELGPGTRGSAVSARQAITRGGLANIVHHLQDEGVTVVGATNGLSIGTRGRHEAVLNEDISAAAYRQQLVDLHVSVRRNPKRVVTFEAAPEEQSPNVPRAYEDFGIGDVIWLRAVDSTGTVAFTDTVRVYSIATTVDDASGTGRHEFTVVPE